MARPLHRDEVDGTILLYRMEGDRWNVATDQDECDHFRSTEVQSPGKRRLGWAGLSGTTAFVRVERVEELPIEPPEEANSNAK